MNIKKILIIFSVLLLSIVSSSTALAMTDEEISSNQSAITQQMLNEQLVLGKLLIAGNYDDLYFPVEFQQSYDQTIVYVQWVVDNFSNFTEKEIEYAYQYMYEDNLSAKTYIYINTEEFTRVDLVKGPMKGYYFVGDKIDPRGSRIKAYYSNGQTEELTIVDSMINRDTLIVEEDKGMNIWVPFKLQDLSSYFTITVRRYKDVPINHEFYQYIDELSEFEIIKGYQDGSQNFGLNDNITRAEFATMFARVHRNLYPHITDPEVLSTNPFIDISKSHWAAKDINRLKVNGLINGYEDGTFKPNNKITRAELSKIIGSLDKLTLTGDEPNFLDVTRRHWAYLEITLLYQNGIINGFSPTVFGPNLNATRGQAAKIFWKLMYLYYQ